MRRSRCAPPSRRPDLPALLAAGKGAPRARARASRPPAPAPAPAAPAGKASSRAQIRAPTRQLPAPAEAHSNPPSAGPAPAGVRSPLPPSHRPRPLPPTPPAPPGPAPAAPPGPRSSRGEAPLRGPQRPRRLPPRLALFLKPGPLRAAAPSPARLTSTRGSEGRAHTGCALVPSAQGSRNPSRTRLRTLSAANLLPRLVGTRSRPSVHRPSQRLRYRSPSSLHPRHVLQRCTFFLSSARSLFTATFCSSHLFSAPPTLKHPQAEGPLCIIRIINDLSREFSRLQHTQTRTPAHQHLPPSTGTWGRGMCVWGGWMG
ncbi:hypothetical protein VULLAG_LOCUS14852 [Vulpes lagopus]